MVADCAAGSGASDAVAACDVSGYATDYRTLGAAFGLCRGVREGKGGGDSESGKGSFQVKLLFLIDVCSGCSN